MVADVRQAYSDGSSHHIIRISVPHVSYTMMPTTEEEIHQTATRQTLNSSTA